MCPALLNSPVGAKLCTAETKSLLALSTSIYVFKFETVKLSKTGVSNTYSDASETTTLYLNCDLSTQRLCIFTLNAASSVHVVPLLIEYSYLSP